MKSKIIKFVSLILALVASAFVFASCTPATPPASELGEIKNIVLIIGDGMGIEHITAGQLYEGKEYEFTNWKQTMSNTDSVDSAGKYFKTTDSAAGGTALATGSLTTNGYVGKNWRGNDVYTILDVAKSVGKKTGVLTTDYLYGATPASFSAHSDSRDNTAVIVDSQLTSGVDLLCGSTASACTEKREQIESNGYTYCDDYSQIEASKNGDKAYWQFGLYGASAAVELCDVTEHALDYLDNDKGFVMMIEQANIDKYSHSNDTEGMVKCVKSLNDTVEAVKAWIGDRKDTAIIITADHETGALNVASTGQTYSYIETLNGQFMYYYWGSGDHTNDKVGVYVYGINPDFSQYSYYKSNHLIKNINVFDIMNALVYDGSVYAK